ncbi:MAG: histidine kinase [Opitutaceae bacterium]|nr:histidine kinase [Opitutaceae bacterium]
MAERIPADAAGARQRSRQLRDRALRAVGIPLLGIGLPRLLGTLAPLGPDDARYWLGTAWFLLLSLALWMGNRWLLLRLSARAAWTEQPRRRLLAIAGSIVAFTLPVAAAFTLAWFAVDARPGLDWPALALTLAVITPAALLVSHLYVTLFLIQDGLEDRLEREQAERARLEAELSTLKSQLAPHLMFNSLHTLGVMIREDPAAARQFNQRLAEICRYLLAQIDRELVPLAEELAFLREYLEFVRLRFPGSVRVTLRGFADPAGTSVPPAALQMLLENALKHNAHDEGDPLDITVDFAGDTIRFANPRRPRAAAPVSTGVGLRNLQGRCQRTVGRALVVHESEREFVVLLPVRREASAMVRAS